MKTGNKFYFLHIFVNFYFLCYISCNTWNIDSFKPHFLTIKTKHHNNLINNWAYEFTSKVNDLTQELKI